MKIKEPGSNRFPALKFINTPWGRRALVLLKLVALSSILYYILQGLDFELIKRSYLEIPFFIYPVAIGIGMAIQIIQALRWKLLALGGQVVFGEYYLFTCISNAMNLISPGAIFSDTVNAYFMGKRNEIMVQSITSILIGRILGIACLGIFAIGFLPQNIDYVRNLPLPQFRIPGVLKFLVALTFLAIVTSAIYLFKQKLGTTIGHLLNLARRPGLMTVALFLSMLVQVATLFIGYLAYWAMEVPINFSNVLFFGSFITVLGLIPLSFGQLGVREGLNIFFFTLIPGVEKENILAAAAYGYTVAITLGTINLLLARWLMKRLDRIRRDKIRTTKE